MSNLPDEQAEPDDEFKANLRITSMIVLWSIIAVLYFNREWMPALLRALGLPEWAGLVIQCGLFGGAIGSFRGRAVRGIVIGALIGPIAILVLFALAFIGG